MLKLKLHMGPRVAIALAQLLLHNKNRSHLVHTADQSSGDSSIASYQQVFTLHTAKRPTCEEQGESDSRSTLEPGCTIASALTLTGNCIPDIIFSSNGPQIIGVYCCDNLFNKENSILDSSNCAAFDLKWAHCSVSFWQQSLQWLDYVQYSTVPWPPPALLLQLTLWGPSFLLKVIFTLNNS